jgi:hypothetical protein
MKRLFFAAAIAIMSWLACGERCECEAGSVGFFGGTGRGSAGGAPFQNAPYGIFGSISDIDTPTVVHQFGSIYYVMPFDPPTISSPAFGTVPILDSLEVFANPTTSTVGLYDVTTKQDILDVTSPAFASFNLSSDMPATTGTVSDFASGWHVPLAGGGDLILDNVSSTVVFSFSRSSVPEPSSLAMLGTGIIVAAGMAARRTRGTASGRRRTNGERGALAP